MEHFDVLIVGAGLARQCTPRGTRGPWKLNQNCLRDLFALRYGRLDDGAMTFA